MPPLPLIIKHTHTHTLLLKIVGHISQTTGRVMPSAKPNRMGVPPPEPEHLPCPRCDSTNTKFCYYNNYNFSQPRHYCKACRRYWTHGGTLRDIPVGGGSRKNAKRSRHATTSALFAAGGHDYRHPSAASTPIFLPIGGGDHGGAVSFMDDVKPGVGCGRFTSLLNGQGPGLLSIGEFGLGFGPGNGFEDVGFGLGRGVWAFSGPGDGGSGAGLMGNTWQVGGGENGFGPGDCFSLPELAISTQGML